MIDWWNLFTNLLWIVGLACALVVFSFADWSASRRRHSIGFAVNQTVRTPLFLAGLALACLGAGLGVAVWWKAVLWLLLAAGLLLGLVLILRQRQQDGPS
jgi:hypothetical protein